MTLYLKYRPQTIDEIDLTNVRETLKKIILGNKIPHALLFAGPKGSGKTSAARILAKTINCEKTGKNGEPCNKCKECQAISKNQSMDVIEMDAASSRRIEDIRELRENVGLSPSSAKKKVYIIDEAHMLTTEASNAFLKTLEEPPSHVVFILATTDPHKLPETVRSRLALVQFTKANEKEVARQIKRIAKGEKIKIDDAAQVAIARASDGSFRDAAKLIEELALLKTKITKEVVEEKTLGPGHLSMDSFFENIKSGNTKESLEKVEKLANEGASIENFILLLLDKLHMSLLAKEGIGKDELSEFTKQEVISLINLLLKAKADSKFSPIRQLPLEIAIAKWCTFFKSSKKKVNLANKSEKIKKEAPAKKVNGEKKDKVDLVPPVIDTQDLSQDKWREIISLARNQNTTMEALLRACEPVAFDGKNLNLGVHYRFHKEKLESVGVRRSLEEMLNSFFGSDVHVSFSLTEKKMEVKEKGLDALTKTDEKDIIQAAKEIFGA